MCIRDRQCIVLRGVEPLPEVEEPLQGPDPVPGLEEAVGVEVEAGPVLEHVGVVTSAEREGCEETHARRVDGGRQVVEYLTPLGLALRHPGVEFFGDAQDLGGNEVPPHVAGPAVAHRVGQADALDAPRVVGREFLLLDGDGELGVHVVFPQPVAALGHSLPEPLDLAHLLRPVDQGIAGAELQFRPHAKVLPGDEPLLVQFHRRRDRAPGADRVQPQFVARCV